MASKILASIGIENFDLVEDVKYLNSITKLAEEYDEFGQGYWKNISMYNASGDASDSQYRSVDKCLPTEYASRCPEIKRLIASSFKLDKLKMVRARGLIDGMVIPHRDFVELDKSISYFRVFVALESNSDSFHSDELGVFQMMAGEVWHLDAGTSHAAINFGSESRMFLCLDFMFAEKFEPGEIFLEQAPLNCCRQSFHVDRKPLSEHCRDEIISSVAKILNQYTFKDVVFALSKYHFIYDIPVACCYEWIINAAEIKGDQVIIQKAKSLRKYLVEKRGMGERYIINDWNA